ncbi:type IV secretion system protein [Jannaschia sp. 2305UL9-9]|uniref:type IV secretion system protein n=1 Tax=Jannaschia sp. 2305UL9-9 TaxID=3121638 RepID=UPI0035278A08
MGFVEKIYTSVIGVLDGVAEQQFGQVAAQLGSTGQILATIAVILMLINLGSQTVPMTQETVLITCVKLVLIAGFLQNWSHFNSVSNAVFDLFDSVSAALVNSVVSGSGDALSGPQSFAASFDAILARVADYANVTAGRLNILGSVINGIVWFLMAVFSAAVALLMVGSRIVITLLIGLAPLAILCTLFSWSKNYFERWLSAVVAFSFYPVVIAAVFATVIGLLGAILDLVGDPEMITSIGQVTPVLGVLCLSTLLAGMVPMIVSSITGNIGLQDLVTSGFGRMGRRLTGMAGNYAYKKIRPKDSIGAGNTAASERAAGPDARDQTNSRAAQINRASERIVRLRRK